jgi:predicted dehydrogenase
MHSAMVGDCLNAGAGVFCEKPFTLAAADSDRLEALSADRGLVTQVGYHNRFVAAFAEVKRLVDAGAIGRITRVLGEAYGPVVLKPQGATWRSQKNEGGGCLYDYAAHVINLVNWYLGPPLTVGGSHLNSVFSREIDDEVSTTMFYPEGTSAQISATWSDESQRKMTTRVTLWGTRGRIFADRQECQVYLRDKQGLPDGYRQGWNVRYTTDLTPPVWYYLRGEEYSAQIDQFVTRVETRRLEGLNDFASAAVTDRTIGMIVEDAAATPQRGEAAVRVAGPRRRWWQLRQPASA